MPYIDWLGKDDVVCEKVKLELGGGENFKGILKSADNDGIVVTTKQGDEAFKYAELNTCKTHFDWN